MTLVQSTVALARAIALVQLRATPGCRCAIGSGPIFTATTRDCPVHGDAALEVNRAA